METNALKNFNQDTSGKVSCLNWKSIFYFKSLGKEVLTEWSIHTPSKNCYKLNTQFQIPPEKSYKIIIK